MSTTIQNTFRCIEAVGRSLSGLTVAEVAAAANLSWPAANRLLESLPSESVLVKDASKRYRLSLRFCEWSNLAIQSWAPINIARKELVKLTMETKRQCNLVVMEDLDAVIVERYELVDGVPINRFISARRIWYETATGKALVAFSSEQDRESPLEPDLSAEGTNAAGQGEAGSRAGRGSSTGCAKSTGPMAGRHHWHCRAGSRSVECCRRCGRFGPAGGGAWTLSRASSFWSNCTQPQASSRTTWATKGKRQPSRQAFRPF